MNKKILITSAGGVGSNSLVKYIKKYDKNCFFYGTHFDRFELSKSNVEKKFLVSKVIHANKFIKDHLKIISKHKIDALIINSDKEALTFSKNINKFNIKFILPDYTVIKSVQDKFLFHKILRKNKCNTIQNHEIKKITDIPKVVKKLKLKKNEKFWLRTKGGAGSIAASWFNKASQAVSWVKLWKEMHNIVIDNNYIVSKFLSGDDFAVVSIWDSGKLILSKIVKRERYFATGISISGMGSTPSLSSTSKNLKAIKEANKAISSVFKNTNFKPHGYFHIDLKCDENQKPHVTEINIGRFPMINSHFEETGKFSPINLYFNLLFKKKYKLPNKIYDLDYKKYILRSVDSEISVISNKNFKDQKKV
ncbi:ATP-grasp domain-containing protein [Pelagibacteraceae bacterium]|nr:ATP-grasp domain-containing protein [Pelagibacteraceae bacterium]